MARSLLSALVLALSTVMGVVLASFALFPAALRRGPIGRRVTSIGRPHPVPGSQEPSRAEQALPQ